MIPLLSLFKKRDIFWPVRLGVRTADFHSVNRGAIPLRATKLKIKSLKTKVFRDFDFKMDTEVDTIVLVC